MADVQHADFIQRAREGDPAAISDLYVKYNQPVFRYLYYRVSNLQTAEDLTSEVFIRMMRSLSGYQPQEVPFIAWLFQIARNLSIDHYRKTNPVSVVSLEETMKAGSDDPTQAVDHRLNNEKLAQALENLNDEQRDVVVMRFIAGMPIQEVAQALSKSEDAIKGLQRRGLLALRQILSDGEISYA